ncbi:MAG: hypothetical protein ACP5T3_01985 [Candidatus Micrarchaeia archaeon]
MLTISLSGSVIANGKEPNAEFLSKFAKLISRTNDRFVVVAGGGSLAKNYIAALRKNARNEYLLDMVGIKATEMNAYALLVALEGAGVNAAMAQTINDIPLALAHFKAVVLYGQLPGITTDTDAALACEIAKCKKLVNVSKLAYIYNKPPEQAGAKKIKKLSHAALIKIAESYDDRTAKAKFAFDIVACKIAARAGIEIRFVDDRLENIKRALMGSAFDGTLVKD